jgi:hypothetical protein
LKEYLNPFLIDIAGIKEMNGYTIATLCFNNESINLCESLDPNVVKDHREARGTTWFYDCTIADFLPLYFDKVSEVNGSPLDVFVFCDQESRHPGNYEHSHLLPEFFTPRGYSLLKRTKMMGVGVTSYKGLLAGDPSTRGLRTSIYVRNELFRNTQLVEIELKDLMSNDLQTTVICDIITRGKGGTISYLKLLGAETLAIINCHLPFGAYSLIRERMEQNKMIRQNQLNSSNVCFNYIFETAVVNSDLRPRHVIYTGDLNYRLNAPVNSEKFISAMIENHSYEYIHDVYTSYDELYQQMEKGNIYYLEEGPENYGPVFYPTCKMVKGRNRELPDLVSNPNYKDTMPGVSVKIMDSKNIRNVGPYEYPSKNRQERGDTEFNLGKHYQRLPSWCDRILHTNWDYFSEVVFSESKWYKDAINSQIDGSKNELNEGGPKEEMVEEKVVDPGWGITSTMSSMSSTVGSLVSWGTGYTEKYYEDLRDLKMRVAKASLEPRKTTISCRYYGRLDEGQAMNLSDHAAVFSIHVIGW